MSYGGYKVSPLIFTRSHIFISSPQMSNLYGSLHIQTFSTTWTSTRLPFERPKTHMRQVRDIFHFSWKSNGRKTHGPHISLPREARSVAESSEGPTASKSDRTGRNPGMTRLVRRSSATSGGTAFFLSCSNIPPSAHA